MTTYNIIGHKSPDTDAVCSALVMQEFMRAKGYDAQVYKLGELNKETELVLKKVGVETPDTIETLESGSEVILVDHNEASQSINNLDELNIYYIIDHHKFNLQTSTPLYIRTEPLGSTCSILAKMFFEEHLSVSKQAAELMISAIISDTLYFRSPTTTQEDKDIVERLNKIAQIDNLEELSLEMFNAKSDLGDMRAIEMIQLDYKEFEFNGNMYGVGVMETTNPVYGVDRLDEIREALTQIEERDNLAGVMFSIVDILEGKNISICSNEKFSNDVKQAFSASELENGFLDLKDTVSRKKQIIPVLKKYFEE
ncbi:MAG: manganese-dependent inorganic pyrophosphatase [Candidatus Nanoarchaeia archaeon]